jgi:hypothetical protein
MQFPLRIAASAGVSEHRDMPAADSNVWRTLVRRVWPQILLGALAIGRAAAQEAPPVARPHDAPGLLPEPRMLAVGMDYAARYLGGTGGDPTAAGFYPIFGGLYTGAGWLSVGGGYRAALLEDAAVADVSAALSWRGYKLARSRFELPLLAGGRLGIGSQLTWQDLTQVNYYGIGSGSFADNRSEYRIKTTDIVGFATYRPVRWLWLSGRAGWLRPPTVSSPAGPFDRGFPDARAMFPEEPAFAVERQPGFLHGDASVTVDIRDYPGHPMRGGFYRAAWTMYSDRTIDGFGFHRYELEGLQVVPILPERLTFLLHAWALTTDPRDNRDVPVYLLPSLGGSSTLRSYSDFRFHDRNLLLASIESRIALLTHVDAAVFVDAGSVARRFEVATLRDRSYGAGIRFHAHSSTIARIDAARGREGWHLSFSLNDPFRLGRFVRLAAPVPFAP